MLDMVILRNQKIQARGNHIIDFCFFAVLNLGEIIKWNTAVVFLFILAAVFIAFYDFSN
jgi:uncharacterized protein (DUF486 family)